MYTRYIHEDGFLLGFILVEALCLFKKQAKSVSSVCRGNGKGKFNRERIGKIIHNTIFHPSVFHWALKSHLAILF